MKNYSHTSSMQVLIIGADGLLGSALKKTFEKEHSVVAWDRAQIDITNRNEVLEKISSLHPDHIINAAAYNNVDEAERDEKAFMLAKEINTEAVGYLAEAANSIGAVLTHFSTDYVFSGESEKPYDENDRPNPISKYGITKAEGEKLLQKLAKKYYLIRLSRLFGPASHNPNSKKSFVDLIAEKAKQVKELSLVNDEVSCQTYSVDLANLVLEIFTKKMPFGIYHGVNSGEASWQGFASEVFKLKGIQVNIKPISSRDLQRPAKRPKYSVLSNTKLPQQRSWQEALRDYLLS